ncbi:MAG: DnaJ domain-containing protein [Pleurocapsa sp. SU_5_0]|nr:DnaJ domain-containing protein [Pleurocapsa sp. SU_5_0]
MFSNEFKDYYAILGVNQTANNSEIKQKFRQLALKYHPDRNQGNKAAESKFKEISEAYEVLADVDKRKKYDYFGQYQQSNSKTKDTAAQSSTSKTTTSPKADFNSTDFSQYGNFDEFIDELLGRFPSPSSSTSSSSSSQTKPGISNFQDFSQTNTSTSIPVDDEASINLTYAEAFRGTIKQLKLEQEIIEIRIPAGVKPDSRIRLAGKGKPSLAGIPRDLYLNVKLEPHSFFGFEGDDLICEVPITFDEAVLGSSIDIPTPDGMISMKIPAGINSGQVLRLRSKGWSSPPGNRTDQLVRIVVATPQNINAQEREYYEKIRDLPRKNPRSNLEGINL